METIKSYLQKIVDDKVTIQKWNAKEKLSLYLAGSFEFYVITLLRTSFLLVKPYEEVTLKRIVKQTEAIEEKTGMPVALLVDKLTAYKSKKMFQDRIAFIAVDKQMYLPFLAIYMKNWKTVKKVQEDIEKFTPAIQLMYLWILYEEQELFEQDTIAQKLEISVMTALRGLNTFTDLGLLTCRIEGKTGRKKIYRRIDKKSYYQNGKKYLVNPVKKTIYVSEIPSNVKVYKSGLAALGDQTMLGEPEHEIVAVGCKEEAGLKGFQIPKEVAMEESGIEVQLMKYYVHLIAKDGYVDPITMIMSMKEMDDRIEIAIDELMEDVEWFEA